MGLTVKKKAPKFATLQMLESDEDNREILLRVTLRDTLIFLLFIIMVTTIAFGNNLDNSYMMVRSFQEILTDTDFRLELSHGNFFDIHCAEDMWNFASKIIIPVFYVGHRNMTAFNWPMNVTNKSSPEITQGKIAEEKSDENVKMDTILEENRILGPPRFRQLRIRKNLCEVPEMLNKFSPDCYTKYYNAAVDKSTINLESSNILDSSALSYASASETGSSSYSGQLARYEGGGYVQIMPLERLKALETIENLKTSKWVDRATRCVFFEYTLYNANLNLFLSGKLVFEISPVGEIVSSGYYYTATLAMHFFKGRIFVALAEICFIAIFMFYIVEEVREIWYYRLHYFLKFWNLIDLIILILCVTLIVTEIIKITNTAILNEKVKDLTKYIPLDGLFDVHKLYDVIICILLLVIYFKLFKFLTFSKSMSLLNVTLSRCTLDVLSFLLMFFIMFMAFAQVGYTIFGAMVSDYSTVGSAMFTLIRTTLGDFDYDAIEEANRYFAPVFFLAYIFFVFFVLLNMFLAIINDTYTEVKIEADSSSSVNLMKMYIKNIMHNCLMKCGLGKLVKPADKEPTKSPNEKAMGEIRKLLLDLGYTPQEISMFFARYNITPETTEEYDTQKIKDALEDLDDMPDYFVPPGKTVDSDDVAYIAEQKQRIDHLEVLCNRLLLQTNKLLTEFDSFEKVEMVNKIPKIITDAPK